MPRPSTLSCVWCMSSAAWVCTLTPRRRAASAAPGRSSSFTVYGACGAIDVVIRPSARPFHLSANSTDWAKPFGALGAEERRTEVGAHAAVVDGLGGLIHEEVVVGERGDPDSIISAAATIVPR